MKRPLRNILALSIGDGGSRAIGFVVTVYLARVLGPEGFGLISIGMAVLGYLLFIASPGVQTVEARNVAAAGGTDRARIGAVLSFRLLLALLLLPATGIVILWSGGASAPGVITMLYAGALIPLAMTLDFYFSGKERFAVVGASRLINAAVYAAAVFLLVRSGGEILFTPVAFFAGAAAAALFVGFLYHRLEGGPRLLWTPAAWRRIAADNLPVGLATFLGQSVLSLPPILIGLLLGAADAGQFSAAMKLVFVVLILDRLLNALLLPVLSRYAAGRAGEIPGLIRAVGRVLLVVVLGAGLMSIVLAPWLVPLVFGEGYAPAVTIVRILALYVVLTLASSLCVVTLIATGRERRYTGIMIRSAVVLMLAVGVLTPAAGTAGAAWGVVAGEAAALVLLARELRETVPIRLADLFLRPVLAALPAIASLFLLPLLHPPVLALVCVVVFLAAVFGGGVVRREDVLFLRERLL